MLEFKEQHQIWCMGRSMLVHFANKLCLVYYIYDSCSLGYYKLLRITADSLDDPDSDYEFLREEAIR